MLTLSDKKLSETEQLGILVEKVCKSGCNDLKEIDCKDFKSICKKGDENLIHFLNRVLFLQLSKNHSQIRCTALLFIEIIFPRSHLFRSTFCEHENLETFFELTLEVNQKKKLPKPKFFANLLKNKTINLCKSWIKKFGEGYPILEEIFNQMISSTILSVSNDHELENQNILRERRNEQKLIEKIEDFQNFNKECLLQLEKNKDVFKILIPEDGFDSNNNEDLTNENERFYSKSSFGPKNIPIIIKPYLTIKQNNKNEKIIENLKEFNLNVKSYYLPKLKSFLNFFSKAENRDTEVKKLIDLKNEFLKFVVTFSELKIINKDDFEFKDGCNYESSDSTSDDEFEEVEEKEICPEFSEYDLESMFEMPSTSSGINKLKNFDPTACNFKMDNGKLCPRKDKINCPFHGKIIPRNENGVILDEKLFKEEEDRIKRQHEDWQDPKFLKDLESQIGIDLTIKPNKKKKKETELVDLKKCDENPRSRLNSKMKKLKKYCF